MLFGYSTDDELFEPEMLDVWDDDHSPSSITRDNFLLWTVLGTLVFFLFMGLSLVLGS